MDTLKISIEYYGRKFTAEIDADSDIDQVMDTLRGLVIFAGWPEESVDQYIKEV